MREKSIVFCFQYLTSFYLFLFFFLLIVVKVVNTSHTTWGSYNSTVCCLKSKLIWPLIVESPSGLGGAAVSGICVGGCWEPDRLGVFYNRQDFTANLQHWLSLWFSSLKSIKGFTLSNVNFPVNALTEKWVKTTMNMKHKHAPVETPGFAM